MDLRDFGCTLVLLAIATTRASAGTPAEGYVTVNGGIRLHYRVLGSGRNTVQIGPLSPRRDPYWEHYLKDRAARVDAAAERQLAEMRQVGVPERDPTPLRSHS